MSCIVKYGNNGEILRVDTPSGEESKAFNSIVKLPFIKDKNEALELYKKTDLESNSPVVFQVGDNTYLTYKEALDSNGNIATIMQDGVEVAKLSLNTNPSTEIGLLNNLVKSGILSQDRMIDRGDTFLKAEGQSLEKQYASESLVKQVVTENGFRFDVGESGQIRITNPNEYQSDPVSLEVDNLIQEFTNRPPGAKPREFIKSEEALKGSILNFLQEIGFSVSSMENYIKKFSDKNGVEPSAEALVDFANKIVAFKDGNIQLEELTEEFSHIIVESMDEASIQDLLAVVDRTEEWSEFADKYFEVYQDENLVRKEILGKVLANSLQNKTSADQSLVERLLEAVREFFNSIFNNEQQIFKNRLSVITEDVFNMLINKDLGSSINLDNLSTKKFRMYSLTSTDAELELLRSATNQTITRLIDQEKTLKGGKGSVAELKALQKRAEVEITKASIIQLTALAVRQIRYIKDAVREATRNGETLNVEEGIVLSSLQNSITPALATISKTLGSKNKQLTMQIDKAIADIAKLNVDQTSVVVDKVLTRMFKNINNTENITVNGQEVNAEQYIRNAVETAQKDTNYMFRGFGQLTHARDPLLNVLGRLIGDLTKKANYKYYNRGRTFQNSIRELGFKESDVSKIYKGNGWISNLFDFEAYYESKYRGSAEIYHKYDKSKTVEEYYEILKDQKQAEPKVSDDVRKEIRAFEDSLRERPMTNDYYAEREAKQAKLSDFTRSILKELSVARSNIMSKVKKINGTPSYSANDRALLDGYNLQRRAYKSTYDIDGDLKQGLELTSEAEYLNLTDKDGWIKAGNGYIKLKDGASDEAVLSYEMYKNDNALAEEMKATGSNIDGLADTFWTNLRSIEQNEGREAAKEYFLLNTNIGYSEAFWDSMGEAEDPLGDYYAKTSDLDYKEDYETYQKISHKRKEILKEYQDSKDATNVLASGMSPDTMSRLRSLTESINALGKKLKEVAGVEYEPGADVSEKGFNSDYVGVLEDEGITEDTQARIRFAKDHMIASDRELVTSLQTALNDIKYGRGVSSYLVNIIERETGMDVSNIRGAGENLIDSLSLILSENRLPVYFRAFTPNGMRGIMDNIKDSNSPTSVVDLVQQMQELETVRMTNHFSFYETNKILEKNDRFVDDFIGGTQPTYQFLDKDFIKKYNPKKDSKGNYIFNEVTGLPEAQSNMKEYDLYKLAMNFQKDSLDSLNETGSHNIFLAPQISKTNLERVVTAMSGKGGTLSSLKEYVNNLTKFRVEELELGEETAEGEALFAAGQRVVPKMYLKQKEIMEDTSSDLFYTMQLFAQQSEVYKARSEASREVLAVEGKILRRNYPNGVAGEATQTYRMAKSYVDYNIFGKKELRNYRINVPIFGTVDVAKTAGTLHKYLRNKNLAYNLIIPMTSWLTAEVQLKIESLVGQYVDKDSMSLASKELRKLSPSAIKESMLLDSNAKLTIIGEHLDIYEYTRRLENSKYNVWGRVLGKIGYIAHTAGNFTPLSKAMLAGLYGHRLYGGEFIDYKTYKRIQKQAGENSDKVIKANWTALEDKTFYSYMNVGKEGVTYDEARLSADGVDISNIRDIEFKTISKIQKVVEAVDGNIREEERTSLQRDFLGRFLTTHKGWLAIIIARRFKGRHFSLQTDSFEEGHYMTVIRKMGEVLGLYKKGKSWSDMSNELKDVYLRADEMERENMRRVGIELAFISALYLVVIGLSAFADDEDNRDIYAVQAMAYLSERLINETTSSQIGVFGEIIKTVQDPVVGFKQTLDTFNVLTAFDSNVIGSGQYAGIQKNMVYAMKNIPGLKATYTIANAETLYKQRQSYMYFNSPDELQPMSLLLDLEGMKELLK